MTDPFKEKLLMALKEEVETREAVPAAPGRHRRKFWSAGLAAATLAGVAAVTLPQIGGGPAYAVEREADGSVKIAIDKWELTPEDIAGFQRKLEANGVKAKVDWLGNKQACAHPRGDEVVHPQVDNPTPPYWPEPLFVTDPPNEDGMMYWRVFPQYLEPGQTFVWEIQVVHGDGWAVLGGDVAVVNGEVPPCQIVPGQEIVGEMNGVTD